MLELKASIIRKYITTSMDYVWAFNKGEYLVEPEWSLVKNKIS